MKSIYQQIAIAGMLFIAPSLASGDTTAPMLGTRISCEDWTKHQLAGDKERDSDISWLFGFFSGYNQFASPKNGFFWHYDEKNLLDKIDHDCSASPKKSVAEVVVNFINALQKSPPK